MDCYMKYVGEFSRSLSKQICRHTINKKKGNINNILVKHNSGTLAGPSGIRAGWVLETKSRLGAE